jgi:hypothetical protein
MGSWPTIVWTCNGFSYVSADDLQNKIDALGGVCLGSGGNGYASAANDATLTANVTCGHS